MLKIKNSSLNPLIQHEAREKFQMRQEEKFECLLGLSRNLLQKYFLHFFLQLLPFFSLRQARKKLSVLCQMCCELFVISTINFPSKQLRNVGIIQTKGSRLYEDEREERVKKCIFEITPLSNSFIPFSERERAEKNTT
jgi:hypothetical protein